jgi:hypothetical protein
MDSILGHLGLKNQHGYNKGPKIPQVEHWSREDNNNNIAQVSDYV